MNLKMAKSQSWLVKQMMMMKGRSTASPETGTPAPVLSPDRLSVNPNEEEEEDKTESTTRKQMRLDVEEDVEHERSERAHEHVELEVHIEGTWR